MSHLDGCAPTCRFLRQKVNLSYLRSFCFAGPCKLCSVPVAQNTWAAGSLRVNLRDSCNTSCTFVIFLLHFCPALALPRAALLRVCLMYQTAFMIAPISKSSQDRQTRRMVENALVNWLKIARPNVLTSAGEKKKLASQRTKHGRSPGSSLHSSIKAADCFLNNKLSMYHRQQGSGTSAMQPSSTTNLAHNCL